MTVPASGTFQVAASAEIGGGGDGAVSLFEDGVQMPGQAGDICAGIAGTLFDAPGASLAPGVYGTPAAVVFPGFCATAGAPGPVLFQTTPGTHTYELRYADADCGCSPDPQATFSNRRLWITTLP